MLSHPYVLTFVNGDMWNADGGVIFAIKTDAEFMKFVKITVDGEATDANKYSVGKQCLFL